MVHSLQLRFAAVLRGALWARAVACVMWASGIGDGRAVGVGRM